MRDPILLMTLLIIMFLVSAVMVQAQETVITTIGQITIIEKPGTPTVTCTTVSPTITICQ